MLVTKPYRDKKTRKATEISFYLNTPLHHSKFLTKKFKAENDKWRYIASYAPEHLEAKEKEIFKTVCLYLNEKNINSKNGYLHDEKVIAALCLIEVLNTQDKKERQFKIATLADRLLKFGEDVYKAANDGRLINHMKAATLTLSPKATKKHQLYFSVALDTMFQRASTLLSSIKNGVRSTTRSILSRIILKGKNDKKMLNNIEQKGQAKIRLTMSWVEPFEQGGSFLKGSWSKFVASATRLARRIFRKSNQAHQDHTHQRTVGERPMQTQDWMAHFTPVLTNFSDENLAESKADPADRAFSDETKEKLTVLLNGLAVLFENQDGFAGRATMSDYGVHLHISEKDCVEGYTDDQVRMKVLALAVNRTIQADGHLSLSHCKSGVGRSLEVLLADRIINITKDKAQTRKGTSKAAHHQIFEIARQAFKEIQAERPGVVAGKITKGAPLGKRIHNAIRIVEAYANSIDPTIIGQTTTALTTTEKVNALLPASYQTGFNALNDGGSSLYFKNDSSAEEERAESVLTISTNTSDYRRSVSSASISDSRPTTPITPFRAMTGIVPEAPKQAAPRAEDERLVPLTATC